MNLSGPFLIPLVTLATCSDQRDPGRPENQPLSITTHNIGDISQTGYRSAETDKLVSANRKAGFVDVYLIQEAWTEGILHQFRTALEQNAEREYHLVHRVRQGLGVLSVYPILEEEYFNPGAARSSSGVLRAALDTPAGRIQVVSVHFDPLLKSRDRRGYVRFGAASVGVLWDLFLPSRRSLSVAQMRRWLKPHLSDPIIIGGDFNTVPFTAPIRGMGLRYRDALVGSGDYFKGTYWKISAPVLPRVDYLFHTKHPKVLSASVIQIRAGDHYPVTATFQVKA